MTLLRKMEQPQDEFIVMNPAVVKKTQEMLGRVIKKPALTENLLKIPPFRYLHDIVSEIIRTTGFMKDLYEENELNSVKDKQSKIAFLQKAIDVVMLVSGKALAAKPAHIVAGHQPEKTNELLQAIAKCCLNKLPSDHAVKRVLGKEKVDMKTKASTSTSKEKLEECECHLSRQERKRITKHSFSGDHIPDQPEEQQHLLRDVEKKHHRVRKCSDSVKDHRQKCVKYKSQDQVQEKERDKVRQKERKSDRGREKDKQWDNEQEMTRERDSPRDLERNKKQQRHIERKQHKDREEGNKSVNGKSKARLSAEPKGWGKTAKPVPASDIQGRKPQPSSAKGQGQRCKIGKYNESVSEGNRHAQLTQSFVLLENGNDVGSIVPSDMASSKRRITQPSSACPATPWVKSQKTYPGMTSAGRLLSAIHPVPIIMDREGEDKQFVKEVAVHLIPCASNMEVESSSFPNSKEQNWVSEAAWKKDKDTVTREIEWLHSSIHNVCCSFLPLGKSMDNLQEDTDAMVAEHHTWRQVNKKHAQALLEEQRATDPTMDPLKAELAELEQLIADQLNKICAVKSNILKNEEKIQKMVTGINISC